jgi:hypothetical protein
MEMLLPLRNNKFQIPNPKHQTNFKFKKANSKWFRILDLIFGICLEFGTWNLEFGPAYAGWSLEF